MQKAFEKIVERLEEKRAELESICAECKKIPVKMQYQNLGYHAAISHAEAIVNQVAEEYKSTEHINCSRGLIDELKTFLKEKFAYNSEQAEVWRSGENVDAFMIGRSDDYMDRANCYGEVMRVIDRLQEEHGHDGWIPCERELPKIHEDTKSSDVVLVAGYDKNADFDWQAMGFYVKADGISRWFFADCRNTDKPIDWIDIVAWQPLPAPYQPKGE